MENIKLNPNFEDKRMAHRQICQMCNNFCRVDFSVSKEHWELGLPNRYWNTQICLECYTRNADERFVPWCKSIIFKPTSLISEIDMLVGEGQIQLLK